MVVPRFVQKRNPFQWYHATRALGIVTLAYGLLVDHTPERGSIILGGFALLGIEKVARGEPRSSDSNASTDDNRAKEGSTTKDSS